MGIVRQVTNTSCCGEDRLLVVLQHGQPVLDVAGMVGTGFQGDGKVGAEKRGTELGNKFFDGIGFLAEAIGQVAVEAGRAMLEFG